MLQFRLGAQSNLISWSKKLSTYAIKTFKQLGYIVEQLEYWEPPELEEPTAEDLDEINDPHQFLRKAYQRKLNNRMNLIEEMENNRPALFAVIWGHISVESEEQVKLQAAWDEINIAKDPLRLLILIRGVHVGGRFPNETAARLAARKGYTSLSQYTGESISHFKERFDACLLIMDNAMYDRPSDQDQAVDFIDKLDSTRFGEFQKDIHNNVILGIGDHPESVQAAFTSAAQYMSVASRTARSTGATVFTSTAIRGRSNRGRGTGTRRSSRNSSSNANVNHDSNNNRTNIDNVNRTNYAADRWDGVTGRNVPNFNVRRKCFICNCLDHIARNCPHRGIAQEASYESKSDDRDGATRVNGQFNATYVTNNYDSETEVILMHSQFTTSRQINLGRFDVLLDNQATAGLFREPELLCDIRDAGSITVIQGVSGTLSVSQLGETMHFGTVAYSPDAIANILSYDEVASKHRIEWVQAERAFYVYVGNNPPFKFIRKQGLHICNMSKYRNYSTTNVEHALIETVTSNLQNYSKRDVANAQKARDLMKKLGYPSVQSMVKLIKAGGILNCPVTIHDLYRAHSIWGPDLASLKGKTKTSKTDPVKVEYIPRSMDAEQTLHIDIMFVEGVAYLVSVSTPLGLTLVNHLGHLKGSRATGPVRDALSKQVALYRSENFTVRTILTDGEGAVHASASFLHNEGIRINPAGAGKHVPTIENKIRQIKERVRAHISVLPFKLSQPLLQWLVQYSVSAINYMPTSTWEVDHPSPKEIFTGRKIDYKKDLSLSFGQYVQAHIREVSNSMAERTEGAIALMGTGNLQGSWKFFCLGTMKIITRDHWTVLPMPPTVIEFLNALAEKEKRLVSRDPIFRIGASAIDDVDDANDIVEFVQPPVRVMPERNEPTAIHNDAGEEEVISRPVLADTITTMRPSANWESVDMELEPADFYANEDPEEPEEEPPDQATPVVSTSSVISGSRYNLRPTRSSWRETNKEYGLHLTVKKAKEKFGAEAEKSIKLELQQMLDKHVFTPLDQRLIPPTSKTKIIRSSMFLKEKFLSTGIFEKLKARLVAGGNMQDRSMYEDISSPTVSTTAVFITAALAAKERRNVVTLDIGGAYLNARMGENSNVLMRLDRILSELIVQLDPTFGRYIGFDGTIVVRLDRALYGCVESAKLWYEHIASTLTKDIGFTKNPIDICVFNKTYGDAQVTVCIYVDDLFMTSVDNNALDDVVNVLTAKYRDVKCHRGAKHSYLGMTFDFKTDRTVSITMECLVSDILREYAVNGHAATPATINLFVINDQSPSLCKEKMNEFHSRVAKLAYLSRKVRPDLSTLCAFLSTRVTCATDEDWMKLERGLKYLNLTQELGIILQAVDPLSIIAHVDAAYGVHADAKSHTGTTIGLGHGVIYVKSSKQKIVSRSSTEAELIGISDAVSQILWTRSFLIAQGYNVREATVYQDNMSTITMAEKGRSTSERTRHIHIRYFFIKDRIDAGEIKLQYLPTEEMVADILTKPLQGELFKKLRAKMMNFARV